MPTRHAINTENPCTCPETLAIAIIAAIFGSCRNSPQYMQSIANAWGQAFSGAGIFSRGLQVAGLAEGSSTSSQLFRQLLLSEQRNPIRTITKVEGELVLQVREHLEVFFGDLLLTNYIIPNFLKSSIRSAPASLKLFSFFVRPRVKNFLWAACFTR